MPLILLCLLALTPLFAADPVVPDAKKVELLLQKASLDERVIAALRTELNLRALIEEVKTQQSAYQEALKQATPAGCSTLDAKLTCVKEAVKK
jgi:hypothetical protein